MSKLSSRKLIILGVATLLVVGGVFWYVRHNKSHSQGAAITAQDPAKIDMNPPTNTEKQETEAHKQELIRQQEQNSTSPKSVTPVIVDAGQYDKDIEVRAFVPQIVESQATCKVTFTQGSTTFTRETAATPDATTTICNRLKVARSDFPSGGSWSVSVSYSSATASGTSDKKTVEIK